LLEHAACLPQTDGTANRVAMLDIGAEALTARIHLIRAAQRSLEIQTIIWVNDEVGRLMMYELIAAARRGVKVRLLLDHFASEKHPEVAAFLARVHPNLEIRLYNPLPSYFSRHKIDPSWPDKVVVLLTRFNTLNQRMHNKIFLVDGLVGITGGRNNENTYYDQARGLNYKDRDVLVVGPVVSDMTKSFDLFWNFRHSVPLGALVETGRGEEKSWYTREDFAFHGLFDGIEAAAGDAATVERLFVKPLMEVGEAVFIADDPGKNKKRWLGLYSGRGKITLALARLVSGARESIYANTPYLVLSQPAIELFRELRERRPGIDIRIATNSLAATDSWFTYAASFREKRVYLQELGFRIYEIKPLPGDMREYMPTYDLLRARPLTPSESERVEALTGGAAVSGAVQELETAPLPGEPYFCLHAKSFVIDDEVTFIGSYNLDPRSENINTEVGLVVRDRAFAAIVKKSIVKDMAPQNAWVVARNPYPAVLGDVNAVLEEFSRLLPLVDPWPVRYAGLYELKKGQMPADPDDAGFYERYRAVGSFPHVAAERGGKILGVWTTKTLFSAVQPLL
jgi:phosphatidylserine/phosphatidylglycerophosphate/cardiolipin synthase-like enzyme